MREKQTDIKTLEKYIDTEIFVPKILHEEALIKSLVIESKVNHGRKKKPPQEETSTDVSEKIRLLNERQRMYDQRL